MYLSQSKGKLMEFTGKVEEKMIDALRGATHITLDCDAGDKEFILFASFDEMLEIGAMAISVTNPTLVMITAMQEGLERVIMFNPSNGNWDLDLDDWVTIDETPSRVILDIYEPLDESLYNGVLEHKLKMVVDGSNRNPATEFLGTRDNLENFIKNSYCSDAEVYESYIRDIKPVLDYLK